MTPSATEALQIIEQLNDPEISGQSSDSKVYTSKTLIERHEKKYKHGRDARVFIPTVKNWRDPLKKNLVKTGRRKPSYRGLAKRQIKKLKKREKMKKLAKRRKK